MQCRKVEMTTFKTDTSVVSGAVLSCISNYSKRNPQYESLVLMTDFEYSEEKGSDVLLVGPAFEQLFEYEYESHSTYPFVAFKYNGKIVFVQSSMDCIINQDKQKEVYLQNCIKLPGQHLGIAQYLKHATLFRRLNGTTLYTKISDRADTLVPKRRVTFLPPRIVE